MVHAIVRRARSGGPRFLLAVVALAAVALTGPTSGAGAAATGHGTDPAIPRGLQAGHNIRLVNMALRVVFSEHRIDQVDRFFASDFVQHSPYAAPGGREELKKWWAGMVYSIPDVTTTVTEIRGQGTDVVTFRTVQGTIVRDVPQFGIKGCGQKFQARIADIFRVRHHKIIAHWEVADTGPFVQLAGRPCAG